MAFYRNILYCPTCGDELVKKDLQDEGLVSYCKSCQKYRFPISNTAVSLIILNEQKDKILLIKQYGRPDYILTAGYVNQTESLEEAIPREISEELGLETVAIYYNKSSYYQPSNTLMVNFSVVTSGDVNPNHEIDEWKWFTFEEAAKAIKDGSLAEEFLLHFLNEKIF